MDKLFPASINISTTGLKPEAMVNLFSTQQRPGKIDNSPLFSAYDGCLSSSLSKDLDYTVVPEAVWQLFMEWKVLLYVHNSLTKGMAEVHQLRDG